MKGGQKGEGKRSGTLEGREGANGTLQGKKEVKNDLIGGGKEI